MTSQLQAARIDWNDILTELKGNDLRNLIEKTRSEVELFYTRGAVGDVIAAINRKADEAERTVKVLQSIDLNKKTDDELIELMKHREELMRYRALVIVHDRITGRARITKQQQQEFIDNLRNHPKSCVRILNTKDMDTLRMALVVIIAVTDDPFRHAFRKAGGLRPVAKLLSLPDLLDDKEFVIHLLVVIIRLVTADENREQWRTVNGLTRLIPFLSHRDSKISLMATEALLNLSYNENNQPVIIAAHSIETIFKNARSEEYMMQYESHFLIRNLVRCQYLFLEIGKERLNEDHYRRLMPLLDPVKVYKPDQTAEYKNVLQLQKIILETLYECAQLEKNQKILGQLGLIRTMQGFFLPMRTNSGTTWSFEVLLRVLKIIDSLIRYGPNRDQFIELKGIALIAAILQNAQNYPEECVMEAASILTTVATKASINQQAYGKMGLQILIQLLKQFPNRDFVHTLVASMISIVSENQNNRAMVLQEGGDKVLLMFIRDSRVKTVLVSACSGLASLCSESRVVRAVVQAKTVPHLVGLLQLNQPELQTNVARVLACVAEASEAGISEIVRNGGIVPLVTLLSDKSVEVREQALLTFGKLLFAPGKAGPENITYFFQAEGERPLLECLLAEQEEVQVPALSIIQGLTTTAENREYLRDAKLGVKLDELEQHPNVRKQGSQVSNFLRLIQMNLKKDTVNARRERSAAAVRGPTDGGGGRHAPHIWLKLVFQNHCKLVPVRDGLTYTELENIIKIEFTVQNWERLTLTIGADEVDVSDQRSLDFVLDLLSKEKGDPSIIVHPIEPILKAGNTPGADKLDVLLQRLTHKQLRALVKDAIDQGADLSRPIREYININRNAKAKYSEERVGGDPRGSSLGGGGGGGGGFSSSPVTSPRSGFDPFSSNRSAPLTNRAAPEGPLATAAPAPPAPPAPPPPPTLSAGSSKLVVTKKGAVTGSQSLDLMSAIKDAVSTGGNLKRVEIDSEEKKKRGDAEEEDDKPKLQRTLMYEETQMGSELWRSDIRGYVNDVMRIFLRDYEIAHIAFNVIDNNEIEFADALSMLRDQKTVSGDDLAKLMLDIGFTVMNANYNNEATFEVIREYSRIMCPYDLPVSVLVKSVRQFISSNRANRDGGALSDDVDTMLQRARQEDAAQTDVVKGYWSSKEATPVATSSYEPEPFGDSDASSSSLFAALDAYEAQTGVSSNPYVGNGSSSGSLW